MSVKKLDMKNLTMLGAEEREVVRNFTTSVKQGEIHALLGRYTPDVFGVWEVFSDESLTVKSGEILYDGEKIPFKKMWKKSIIRLDGPENVFAQYNIIDNIFICQKDYYRRTKRAKIKIFNQLMEKFHLDLPPYELVNNIPYEWRTLIALLRIAVQSPEYCILYDVLNQLSTNLEMMEKGKQIIHTLRDEYHVGIVYLTTRYEDAIAISDRITVLVDGRINGTFYREEFGQNPQQLLYCLLGWTSMQEQDNKEKLSTDKIVYSMLEMQSTSESVKEIRNVLHYISENVKEMVAADKSTLIVLDNNRQISMTVGDEIEFGERLKEALLDNDGKIKKSVTLYDERNNRTEIMDTAIVSGEPACILYTSYTGIVADAETRINFLDIMIREALIAIETYHVNNSSILLRETHHRIKNNLQIIINLLYIQQVNIEEQYGKVISDTFEKPIYQVKSIALVHDLLTSDKKGNNIINLRLIIERIIDFYRNTRVMFDAKLEDYNIPYDKAATVSLLVNEIISNSLKHAFHENDALPHIQIECEGGEKELIIKVKDNGEGFPDKILEQGETDVSVGMELIQTITRGLGGKVELYNDGGAGVKIVIPNKNIYVVQFS